MECDYLIVGAGIFGITVCERIANDLGAYAVIIDKRNHIGGNCYSEKDEQTGIEVHRYGTHIFHTSQRRAWDYFSKFSELNGYHHQVLANYKNKIYQLPINLETINSFYNLNLTPKEAKDFIESEIKKENIIQPANLEEQAIALVGRPLYEAFIKGYTQKQWAREPNELPAEIIMRLPLRFDYKEDYFKDSRWQGVPVEGYTKAFERMLDSPKIKILLECDYLKSKNDFKVKKKVIYTGPLDRYFDYSQGKLEWRSIELKKTVLDTGDFQGTSVMNYTEKEIPYTRIHEPRHLHPEGEYRRDKTVIYHEHPCDNPEEPIYCINTQKNNLLAKTYQELFKQENAVYGGHLAEYAYYNMDETILAALDCYEHKILPCP